MIDSILAYPHAFWLTLGGLLLAAEMLGAGGYLLWSGIAAVITGLLAWPLPLSWEIQGTCFALLTLAAAFFWWRWLSGHKQRNRSRGLNQRSQQLIGRRFRLEAALVNGRGNVRVADSSWPVAAESDLPASTEVVVTAVEGIRLLVEAV